MHCLKGGTKSLCSSMTRSPGPSSDHRAQWHLNSDKSVASGEAVKRLEEWHLSPKPRIHPKIWEKKIHFFFFLPEQHLYNLSGPVAPQDFSPLRVSVSQWHQHTLFEILHRCLNCCCFVLKVKEKSFKSKTSKETAALQGIFNPSPHKKSTVSLELKL